MDEVWAFEWKFSRVVKTIFLFCTVAISREWICVQCGWRQHKRVCRDEMGNWTNARNTITEDSRKIISLCHPIYHLYVTFPHILLRRLQWLNFDFSFSSARESGKNFMLLCCPCLVQFNKNLFSFWVASSPLLLFGWFFMILIFPYPREYVRVLPRIFFVLSRHAWFGRCACKYFHSRGIRELFSDKFCTEFILQSASPAPKLSRSTYKNHLISCNMKISLWSTFFRYF